MHTYSVLKFKFWTGEWHSYLKINGSDLKSKDVLTSVVCQTALEWKLKVHKFEEKYYFIVDLLHRGEWIISALHFKN